MTPHPRSEPKVACPSCGADNRLGTPFCSSCGERMYKNNGELPKVKIRTTGGAKRAVRNAGFALLIILGFGAVALLLWPYPLPRPYGSASGGARVASYAKTAARALKGNETVPEGLFHERELNAFLAGTSEEGEGPVLRVWVGRDQVILYASEPTGPLRISTRLVMEADKKNGPLRPESLWVGHLPLPSSWAEMWSVSLARRFSLGLDRELWRKLELLRAGGARVLIGVGDEEEK